MGPSSCIDELSGAVVSRLRGLPGLVNLSIKVYDGTAPSVNYPYAVVRDWEEREDNGLGAIGRQVTFAVHTYSNYEGVKQVGGATNIIIAALEEQEMDAPNWRINKVAFHRNSILNESNEVRHAITRFRIWIVPK